MSLSGLGDTLYGLEGDDLYTIDVMTGARTSARQNVQDGGALGEVNGVLYTIDGGNLYSGIQPGGVVTQVGSLGIAPARVTGLAGLQGALYGVTGNETPSNLYIIDTATGAATLRGSVGGTLRLSSLAGLDVGVSPAVRLHIIPDVRVDMWRPTGTTNELGFYSERATTILQVVGVP